MRGRFYCYLLFKYSLEILTIDNIQQSYKKLLLKHFTPFRHIEVTIFLSSPFPTLDEDPDNLCCTTTVNKAVTETLQAPSTNWGVAFLSSPFQLFDEDTWNWRFTTNVYQAVTETLHALSTNWVVSFPVISISKIRWSSWQLLIYNNRI